MSSRRTEGAPVTLTGLQWTGVQLSVLGHRPSNAATTLLNLLDVQTPFLRSAEPITVTVTAEQRRCAVAALRAEASRDGLSVPQREALNALNARPVSNAHSS